MYMSFLISKKEILSYLFGWLFALHAELVGCHAFQEEPMCSEGSARVRTDLNNPVDFKSVRNVHSSTTAFCPNFQKLYHWCYKGNKAQLQQFLNSLG